LLKDVLCPIPKKICHISVCYLKIYLSYKGNQLLSPRVAVINFRNYQETKPPSSFLQFQFPPASNSTPARRRLDTRLAIHGAIQSIRCAIRHNARASVGLTNAPATFVSGELRLGAVAAKAAQKKLRKALDLLREPYVPHPGIRPGCMELPRYPKPKDQKEFHAWLPMTYYSLYRPPGIPIEFPF
jgi:hypothetical protein